jgi:hypothetical protein
MFTRGLWIVCLQTGGPDNAYKDNVLFTYVFIFYFRILSLARTLWCRIIGCLMNDYFEWMWNKKVVAYLKYPGIHLTDWTKPRNASVSTASSLTEVRTKDLRNTTENVYRPNKFSVWKDIIKMGITKESEFDSRQDIFPFLQCPDRL